MLWFQLSRRFSRAELFKILLSYSPIVSVLNAHEGITSPLACAAMKGNAEDLELLLNSGVSSIDNDTAEKRTIKYSIIGSNPSTFDFLVSFMPAGWVSEVDHQGSGPLHWAMTYPSVHTREIVQRLLNAGADVHLRDMDGEDPGGVARACDKEAEGFHSLNGGLPRNLPAYYEALKSNAFNVELDENDDLWWPPG
ncbi:MAG: hypothetical protein Q9201_007737 [Fulgogasparrea decipioides]